ncbi:MAG: TrmH family RNA methyltransferase [bacterium]|nr:TrmH family RNA methyltransferase [bacterium]
MIKLGAKELRSTMPEFEQLQSIKRNPIYIVLDNVFDTYNVGSIFRLADAVAAEKVLLCGQTETPPNPRIKKASVDTWQWIEWEHAESAKSAIENLKLKIKNLRVYAVEQSEKSVPYDKVEYGFPLALVVGNETYGVSKDVLDISDNILEIPMFGVNKSLNVMVSLGIVLFEAMKNL